MPDDVAASAGSGNNGASDQAAAARLISDSIFRQEAIDHYRAGSQGLGAPLKASHWVERWYFLLFALLVLAGLSGFWYFRRVLGG
jgi:hypothetical protein